MDEKIDPDILRKIKEEVALAEKLNEEELEPIMRECLNRYTSRHIPDIQATADWDVILNEAYPIIQYELPSIFFRNPKTFLKPRNKTFIAKRRNPSSGAMEEIELDSSKSAKTQEAILNYKLETIRYKRETQKVLMDALMFPHGIQWHGYKGSFGMTSEQSMYIEEEDVFVMRLNPLRFLKDPSIPMSRLDEARWVGRSFDVPLQDLLEDDKLYTNKSELKGKLGYGYEISEKQGVDGQPGGGDKIFNASSKPLSDFLSKDFKTSPHARFVKCYEIFMRPTPKEKREGSKGTLLLYTKEQVKPLRVSPWPYKAKGWPAKVLCFNELNDDMFGLSDVQVWGAICDQKNAIVNIQLRNAKENSKVWVGFNEHNANEEDVEKIRNGQQTIIGFNDGTANQNISVQSASGVGSGELYQLDGRIQKNLDEKSGVTDLRKGFLQSGEESAASAKIRNMGGSVRALYRQDIMSDHLKESIHFLNQLIKQYYPVEKAVRIIGSLDVQWSDNPSKEEIQAETDVEIDVISMLPEDPEKELQELTTVLNLMLQAINDPGMMNKIAQEGMTFTVSSIIQQILIRLRVKDPEVYRKIKPEESEGFVSVKEVRAAGDNVESALAGQPPPSPPQPGQDHKARMEMYARFSQILQELGDTEAGRIIMQLLLGQQAVMEEENVEAEAGKPVSFKVPKAGEIGRPM